MNSVCQDCLISYCSCSKISWKDAKHLQDPCPEAEWHHLNHSPVGTFSSGSECRDDNCPDQGDFLKENQNTFLLPGGIFTTNPGVGCFIEAVGESYCYLHSCCSVCHRPMTVGSSWKRSVKRKMEQTWKEEEMEQVLKKATLLKKSSDLKEGVEGKESGNGWTLRGLERVSENGGIDAPLSREPNLQGNNSEDKSTWEELDGNGDKGEILAKQDEVRKLREAMEGEHQAIAALYAELEEERKAAAVAAMETMAMISRLQNEKAAVEMEARQYQRKMEDRTLYDQEAISLMKEILLRNEEDKFSLEKDVEFYQKMLLSNEAKSWSKGSRDFHGYPTNGKEERMLLLEDKDRESETLDGIPCRFQMDNALGEYVISSTVIESPDAPSLSSNSRYDDLLKDLGGCAEKSGRYEKAQLPSSNRGHRRSGKNLMNSFNHAALQKRCNANDQLLQVGRSSDLVDRLKERTYEANSVASVSPSQGTCKKNDSQQLPASLSEDKVLQPTYPVQELIVRCAYKENNQFESESQTDSPLPNIQNVMKVKGFEGSAYFDCSQKDYGIGYKASKIFSRSLLSESTEEVPMGSTGYVDGDNGEGSNNTLESLRTEGEERSFLDGEEGCSSSVHDVYEVQCRNQEDSTSFLKRGHYLEQNECKFLERYGSTWRSIPPRDKFSGTSPPDVEVFCRRRIDGSVQLEHSESGNWRDRYGDMSIRERFEKPEFVPGNIDVENQGPRRRQGLVGKRKQIVSLSEREDSRSAHADSYSCSFRCDSSVTLLNNDLHASSSFAGNSFEIRLEDKVKELTLRLQALEEDREFLKQTILRLKKGSGEMQMLQHISKQLQQFRTEEDANNLHESTFSSILKGVFSFNRTHGFIFSQLHRLACLFIRGARAGPDVADPVGLTHLLDSRDYLQTRSCITRGIKAEVVIPAYVAGSTDDTIDISFVRKHVTNFSR